MGTVPYVAALGLALLGLVLLAVGARGPWLAAVGGGMTLGAAVAVALVAARMQPLGGQTPAVVLLMGLLLGLAVAGAARLGGVGTQTRR